MCSELNVDGTKAVANSLEYERNSNGPGNCFMKTAWKGTWKTHQLPVRSKNFLYQV